ncbi:hypothetical protein L873DRAFT_996118 [Choiromyces venosus 120613-1]|uniref:Uncharacterized protein n=1 Tax=Choiromyces venosus 120613-1 TaxID=1336337 RepID=A0A3N4JKW9_9PEZI|nr:hypothetical protein L873DRAFT_996118 [Choiromyces venosus 120613-1]
MFTGFGHSSPAFRKHCCIQPRGRNSHRIAGTSENPAGCLAADPTAKSADPVAIRADPAAKPPDPTEIPAAKPARTLEHRERDSQIKIVFSSSQ